MADSRRFRRLSMKLLAMLLLAAAMSTAVGLTVQVAGDSIIANFYCSQRRQEARLQETITALRRYVDEGSVASTDAQRIGAWNREHPYIQLTIYANNTVLTSDRWGAELVGADSGLVMRVGSAESADHAYPVNFADGAYQVHVYDYSQSRWYGLMNWISIIAGGVVFLVLMLLYNSRVTLAIGRLSRQVRRVSQGNLALEIMPPSRDEIGNLAEDVDAMRLSIIDKLQREETAWHANTQLITAISHDIRTPLTALIGYLDILSEGPDLTEDQRQQYLEVCCRKAEKLRDLTNELFSYFLVFGKPDLELNLEEYDALTLLDQILGEQMADLTQRGYVLRTVMPRFQCQIRVDVQHLRRVFDNLFSNVLKYADQEKPVTVAAVQESDTLHVCLSNYIKKDAGAVESTKIGLQTCEKLLNSMGGTFLRYQDDRGFTAEVILPICGEPAGEKT